ncbi:ABC transporter permease [Halosimplex rubrum]|uniref:ABC transporter permease n=1 Tax=Halosimplex rubrum TaxID=869889 RepID=A0A7D5P5U1_9EURY|nr:ABC transporter permease [Halosimplex rubrum]QLH78445.1 ABC transporter permease [Halosimplex rubrum]
MTASEPTNQASSSFETVSDIERSRKDRYSDWLSANVATPMKILLSDRRGRAGLSILALYLLMGTIGVSLVPEPENTGPVLYPAFQSLEYPLGTNRYGADILAQIVHATPGMLQMMLGGAVFSMTVAIAVGTLSGYAGGRIDSILMTVTDSVIAIPALPLIIVLSIVFTPRDPFVVGVVISIPAWAGLARSLRSEVLSLREESFIEASRIVGLSTSTILLREIIPNLMPYIVINTVNAARGVIFGSIGLYFLGILPQTFPNWGLMMQRAYNAGSLYTWETAHWLILPMAAVVVLSYGLIMLGQAADKIFNPRLKARHIHPTQEEN